ncbi:hypothetical protein JCM11491_002409 [Sporobolomyces phaffii]
MTPSPPASPPPDNDNDAPIDLEDDVPEEQKPREAPASLATRFKSLCRASPPPDTASGPPVPTSRPHVLPRPNCRTSKQKVLHSDLHVFLRLAQQVMENRAEIARLRHEANVLAKILRLTPVDFDLFHRSQNPSATSSRTAPTTTSPTPIPPRPLPQSRYSFSTLPPLTIPSPSVSRPSTGLPPRPAHLTPHPSTTASPRRRPHYVLPTPIYSSTPTSASFFPLSSTKSHSKPWPLFPPYETKTISPRVQPYTPLSAVRDEKPKIEKEEDDNDDIIIVKFDPRPSSKSSEAKESHKEVSPPRKVAPTLKNLLND